MTEVQTEPGACDHQEGIVDRCVCRGTTFSDCVKLSAEGLQFQQIRQRTGCGGACGLCVPYIKAAIATGRISLPVMTTRQLRELTRVAIPT